MTEYKLKDLIMFDIRTLSLLSSYGIIRGFPTNSDYRCKVYDAVRMATINLPNNFSSPGEYICSHMECIKEKTPYNSGTIIGDIFENLFLHTLLHYRDPSGYMVDPEIIYKAKECFEVLPKVKRYCVDIDILLHSKTAFFLKTSLRERWKQWDRDAKIVEDHYFSAIRKVFVCFRENDDDSISRILDNPIKTKEYLSSKAEVLTTYDNDGMIKLFNSLVCDKKEPLKWGFIH